MAKRLKNVDRDTPMLLPPDMRDWLPEDHIARFVVEAVESLGNELTSENRQQLAVCRAPALCRIPAPKPDKLLEHANGRD